MIFQQGGQRKNISRVIVHDQRLPSMQRLVGTMEAPEDLLLGLRQVCHHPVQKQRRFIKEPVR